METKLVKVSVKGAAVEVPATTVNGRTVISTGKLIRIASVHEEDWFEGEAVDKPEDFVGQLKAWRLRPDIFAFARRFPEVKLRYSYPYEWDNVAAIPITTFLEWWEKRVSHDLRKDVKRAEKRGIVVRIAKLDDEFALGIKGIYDETPIRQGRPFWHYGKSLEAVKRDNSSFADRSEFLGAYCSDELVGFLKMVYVAGVARMMQIIAKISHQDKRPMNALIAKAVEVCEQKNCSYLTYGNYVYGNKRKDSVVDFKRRNGFEKIIFPRYYVPLTVMGFLASKAKLHLGLSGLLPWSVIYFLLKVRARALRGRQADRNAKVMENAPAPQQQGLDLQA